MPSFGRKLIYVTLPFGLSQVPIQPLRNTSASRKNGQQITYSPREKHVANESGKTDCPGKRTLKAFQYESPNIRTTP